MKPEERPVDQYKIEILGDVVEASLYLITPLYGIKFKVAGVFGYNSLILDYNTDIMYLTEYGFSNEPGIWKRFKFPEEKEQLLTEICNESKRRFEKLADSLISQ